MRCLITGAFGFVGKFLSEHLHEQGYELFLTYRTGEKNSFSFPHTKLALSLEEKTSIQDAVQKSNPDCVVHLAGQPFVPRAIENPIETLRINVEGTVLLLEALRNLQKPIRFLYVSSADVYGPQTTFPISESANTNPVNPYSASKKSAEVFIASYQKLYPQLETLIARPFNHIGVGQNPIFVVPNFVNQINKSDSEILVGDTSPTRDFLDVRDVVKAYGTILKKGNAGEIYNICSGGETSIQKILEILLEISGKNLKITREESRVRKAETPRLLGDNSKLKSLDWKQEISLKDSLKAIYDSLK